MAKIKMTIAELRVHQSSAPPEKKKRKQHEGNHQLTLCEYIKVKYPDVIFASEGSGVKLTMGQAIKAKRMRSKGKQPDLFIAEPRGIFHGLVLELKEEGNSPFKADGALKRKWDKKQQLDVIAEQARMLDRMKKKGYYAKFSVGIQEMYTDVDYYMSLPENYGKV